MPTQNQVPGASGWVPASVEAITMFQATISDWPELETRKMFGYPCAFAHGRMLLHLFGESLVLRLADADRAAFIAATGATTFAPMIGRAMKSGLIVPPAIAGAPETLAPWIARAIAHAQSLPPKVARPKKAKAKA